MFTGKPLTVSSMSPSALFGGVPVVVLMPATSLVVVTEADAAVHIASLAVSDVDVILAAVGPVELEMIGTNEAADSITSPM